MPAKLIAYNDKDCKQELLRDTSTGAFIYTYFTTDETGKIIPCIDGITGDKGSFTVYLKNVGTRAALRPRLIFSSVNHQFILDKKEYSTEDIPIDGIVEIVINFNIKAWTAAQINETLFTLDYYSLPDTTTDANVYNQYIAIADQTNVQANLEGV